MKKNYFTKISLSCLLCLLITLAGCCIQVGCGIPLTKYEKIVQLSAPLSPGSVFAAQTHNGSITITGAEVPDCNLTATITARAGNQKDAERIAEETKIKLEPFGRKLTAKIQKPHLILNQSVSVSLNVTLPIHTDTELITHNGAVKITNIIGKSKATTHNGGVKASQISGTAELRTHNGSIRCKELSGDIRLTTHNGGVTALYCETAPHVCSVSIVTHNGGIDFASPPNFSAQARISTHNGSIRTNLPITVIGKVAKRKLTGTIGTGRGKLHLETHNGSIKIK